MEKKEDYKLLDSHLDENLGGREIKCVHHSQSGLVTTVTKMTATTTNMKKPVTRKETTREVAMRKVTTKEVATREVLNESYFYAT